MSFDSMIKILTDELTAWYETAVAGLPNFLLAVVVTVAFALLARVTGRFVRRLLEAHSDSRLIVSLATVLTRYVVLTVGLFIGLGILGLQKTVFSLLAGAGVVGLAIGFAFQDLAANLIAGIAMAVRRPFSVGDVIETGDFLGTVRKMNLRNTLIETFSGQLVIIPNKEVFENPLVNYTSTGKRRIELAVGVSYDTDLELAGRTAREAVERLECLAPDTEVDVVAREFGASSIDFSIRYWIPYPGEVGYPQAVHRGVLAVKSAFDERGIDIPFPIRTLDFSPTDGHPVRLALDGREASERKLEAVHG